MKNMNMTRLLSPIAIAVTLVFSTSPVVAGTLAIAKQYVGLHERSNRSRIRSMIGVDPVRIPWCGAFATFVVRKAGRKPPKGHNMARSWLGYGKPVKLSAAKAGDVVVLGRHVGFFHSVMRGKVCLIGGNQSNRVQTSCYASRKIRGIRR